MPYRRFLAANAVGGSLRAAVVVLLGHGAGAAWGQAQGQPLTASLVGGAALAAVVGALLWRSRRRRRAARATTPHGDAVSPAT